MTEKNDTRSFQKSSKNVWLLGMLAIVLWLAYFALAHPPGGAPFIYAEF